MAGTDLARALRRGRFEQALEVEFRSDYEAAATGSRLILGLMSLVLVCITPLYDSALLGAPAAFLKPARWIQFGIEVPSLLLAVLCVLPRLRKYSQAATVFAALMTGGGLYAQRVIGAGYGFVVPFDFVAITIAGVFLLARLRFWLFFPWALLLVIAAMVGELRTFHWSSVALYNCISLTMLFALLATGGWMLERTARENWYRRRQLSVMALHDPLTGLPNRRHFDTSLVQLVRAAARERGNVALMLIDIDHFKAYNDHYGHPAGDACLRRIGEWMQTQMRRPHDFCARIGGEEFAAVWADANPADSQQLAETLRRGITDLAIAHAGSAAAAVVTASAGFVELIAPHPQEAARGISRLMIRRADALLYKAKSAGRNRLLAG